jgi:hypothetical protein
MAIGINDLDDDDIQVEQQVNPEPVSSEPTTS